MAYPGGLPFDPSTVPTFAQAAAEPQTRSPFRAGLVRVGAELSNNIPLAVEKGLGTLTPQREAEYQAGLRRGLARSDALLPGGPMSIGQVGSVGDVGTLIKENLLYSLPQMAASIGGAVVARRNPFTGATLAGTPFFVGSNITRATEGGTEPLTRGELARSVAIAPAQALADTAAERFLPFAGSIFGKGAATQTGNFLQRTGKSMLKAGLTEAVTETGQQVGERFAAGLILTNPDAAREYVQSFGTAFFVGGAMGGLGGFRKPAARVSNDNASNEELKDIVDQQLQLPSPTSIPPVARGTQFEVSPAGVAEQAPNFSYNAAIPETTPRPFEGSTTPELETAVQVLSGIEGLSPDRQAILDEATRELDLRNVKRSATETSASSVTEAVEPTLSDVSGGAASNLGAPASIPWETQRNELLKGVATRKAYLDATSPEDVASRLRARLEAGSTAKSDFLLAERMGIDTNAPSAPVEAAQSRVQAETGAATPVAKRSATPVPAAPANLEGGDQPVDPEFEAWWKGRKKGKDKSIRALKPVNFDDLTQQVFRELGEPRNVETLFAKGDQLEQLAQDEKVGLLDPDGNPTPKMLEMARAQGIIPPTINEAQSQEIIKRRGFFKPIPIPEENQQQQLLNQTIDEAGLQPAKQESEIAVLKRMVRDGDIEGAMMGLQRVRRGESLFVQPERQAATYTGGERASGVVNRQRIESARQTERDLEAARKITNRQQAEEAIRKLELSQSIDVAFERGVIDGKERMQLVGKLRQGRYADVARAVPVLKADPARSVSITERVQRRKALVSDLQDALAEAYRASEVSELNVGQDGVLREDQVKVARRDFLAGVGAAIVTASVPTQSKAAIAETVPISKTLSRLIANGNPVSVLQHIKSSSKDSSYRLIAAKLLHGNWSKVAIIPRDGTWNVMGATTLNDDGSTTVEIMGDITSPGDGHNEQTILHELIHAYIQQRWGSLTRYTPGNKELLNDTKDRADAVVKRFQDLWEQIGMAIQKTNPGLIDKEVWASEVYRSPSEMMSWVLTNPDAQAYLKTVTPDGERIATPKPRGQMTLWDKIVEFFAKLFGTGTSEKVTSALDVVLSAGYAVLDAGATIPTGDFNVKLARHFAEQRSEPMLKGPPKSAAEFSAVAQQVTNAISDAATIAFNKPAISATSLKAMVGWMPLTHMAKRYGELLPGLKALFDAHARRRATASLLAHLYDEPKIIADQWGNSKEGQKALEMTHEIMEATAFDYDSTVPWEKNDHLHEFENADVLKRRHAEDHRKYNILKGNGRHILYDTYRQLNELERFMGMSIGIRQLVINDPTLLAAMPQLEADPVDQFSNDATLQNAAAARRYWRDVLDEYIRAVGDYFEALRGAGNDSENKRLSPLETYLKEVKKNVVAMEQAPYFHLGRHGEQFISAKVRLGDDKKVDGDAVEHVARELEKIGIRNARITRDLNKPTIYLRVEHISQREAIKDLFVKLEGEGWLKRDSTIAAPRDKGEYLPERIKTEMEKLIRATKAQFEPTSDMTDEEADAARKLQHRVESAIYDVWLDMLPDTAISKVLTHRESKPGYDKDMARNFAFRYNIGVNNLASMTAQPYIDEAFKQMRGRVNEAKVARSGLDVDTITTLYAEMAKREENLSQLHDDTRFDKWRAVTHAYFLGLSPSYALINLTQVPVLLWPELAKKHGFVGAAKAIAKVTPLAFKIMRETAAQGYKTGGGLRAVDTIITPEVLRTAVGGDESALNFLQNMIASGIIDIGGHTRELGTIAEGKADDHTQKALRYAAAAGLYSETVTRLIAALAARELHRGDFDSTTTYAKDVVRESMLEYSTFNTPRHMGKMGLAGPFTPVMTQFMQYSTQLTFKLYRELHDAFGGSADARKFLFAHLGAVTALAGTLGLPFATAAAWALEKLVDALDDDEEPFDATAAWRRLMANIFGEKIGEMVSRGIPRAGGEGFDLSQRAGEQNLLPFSQWLTDKREFKDASAEAALRSLGAPVSMITNIGQGLGQIADGKVIEGMAAMVPLSIKGPTKAFQMSQDGYVDSKGNKLPMTPKASAYLAQLLGFNPAERARYMERNSDSKARDVQLKQRAGVLRSRMRSAVIEGDREMMRETWAEIEKFNRANPAFVVTASEIERSVQRHLKLQATSRALDVPIGVRPEDVAGRQLIDY